MYLPSNYALERSVTGFCERAAGAQKIIAPTARVGCLARPAQCGRWADRRTGADNFWRLE